MKRKQVSEHRLLGETWTQPAAGCLYFLKANTPQFLRSHTLGVLKSHIFFETHAPIAVFPRPPPPWLQGISHRWPSCQVLRSLRPGSDPSHVGAPGGIQEGQNALVGESFEQRARM